MIWKVPLPVLSRLVVSLLSRFSLFPVVGGFIFVNPVGMNWRSGLIFDVEIASYSVVCCVRTTEALQKTREELLEDYSRSGQPALKDVRIIIPKRKWLQQLPTTEAVPERSALS